MKKHCFISISFRKRLQNIHKRKLFLFKMLFVNLQHEIILDRENADGAAYNLAGQKVADGFKGLVIKNGKKIIVK